MSRKGWRRLFLAGALLAMVVALWLGGRSKWELMADDQDELAASTLSTVYQEKLQETPDDPIIKYNLACLSYQQKQFEEAEKLLSEIVENPEADNETVRRAYYNLGNTLVRLSEKSGRTEQALALLQRSLQHYRVVMDGDWGRQYPSGPVPGGDEDAEYNYTLVKQRIKILADELEQKRKSRERKKELYAHLKELIQRETHLQAELAAISTIADTGQRQKKRNQLLNEQAENLQRLGTVREQIMEAIEPRETPGASAAPMI